jgi:hypothetical protein
VPSDRDAVCAVQSVVGTQAIADLAGLTFVHETGNAGQNPPPGDFTVNCRKSSGFHRFYGGSRKNGRLFRESLKALSFKIDYIILF